MKKSSAFTLIELMVTIVIIGVLAAVAVPQYKRVMLKSRFSTVMPVAKAIADAQELYYVANGSYASKEDALDIGSVKTEKVDIGITRIWVQVRRTDIPGATYRKYYPHAIYPLYVGETHCIATDDEAEELCAKILGGTFVEGSGSSKTYVLEGDNPECTGTVENLVAASGAKREVSCRNGQWDYSRWRDGGFYNKTCDGNSSDACVGLQFASGTHCDGKLANACSGSSFLGLSYCNAMVEHACDDTTYLGTSACCYAQEDGYCPEGSRKCVNGTRWDRASYW